MMIRIAIAIVIVTAALTAPAAAQPAIAEARAKELYEAGRRYYDIAEYAQAIAAWKESHALSGAPLLLFNIGQAYRLSGDCPHALRFYADYKKAQRKPKNKKELDAATKKCAGFTAATDTGTPPTPPATVTTPPPPPTTVTAPPEKVPAPPTTPTTATTTTTSAPPPSGKPLDYDEMPRVPPPEEPGVNKLRLGGAIGAGVGVAVTGVGIYYLAVSAKRDREVEDWVGEWTAGAQALDDEGNRANRNARIGLIAGPLLIMAGATAWVFGARGERNVNVAITPTGGEVLWSCAF